jgi:DNA polymerase-3 subunit epsilon
VDLALFYDTETTGLPLFSEPSEDPRQPHIVQLAGVLVDLAARKTVASIDLIVRPEGWTIPDEVAAIHGITTERALALGVPEPMAVRMLMELWGRGGVRVGHNESFDARILRIALKRYEGDAAADVWKEGRAECTARMATPVCALPPTDKMKAAKRFHYKTPTLSEAVSHILHRDLQDAHSAMADACGCRDLYFALTPALAEAA